jgi:hypothetical protein
MKLTRLLVLAAVLVVASVAAGSAAAQGAGGVTGPAFYVDGELYRTVGTPTDLGGTGAPAHSYDTIYEFFGNQPNVATAAPGDKGYNGGRWRVQFLDFPSGGSGENDQRARYARGDSSLRGGFDVEAHVPALHRAGEWRQEVATGGGRAGVIPSRPASPLTVR